MDPQNKLLNTVLSKLQKIKIGSIGKEETKVAGKMDPTEK